MRVLSVREATLRACRVLLEYTAKVHQNNNHIDFCCRDLNAVELVEVKDEIDEVFELFVPAFRREECETFKQRVVGPKGDLLSLVGRGDALPEDAFERRPKRIE